MFIKYKRKIIQLTSAILYNINFKGFKDVSIYQGKLKTICVPGLNCYSCPGAIASCPLGSIQKSYGKFPFYLVGLLVLFGVIFGRVICGFLCPFGLIQEILYKIKTKKIKKNKVTYQLTYIKYFILVFLVILIPIFTFAPSFCKYICPAGTLEAGLFHVIGNEKIRELAGGFFTFKVIILMAIIIMSVFMYRFFCRFICPLGAFYSFFNKISIIGLKVDMKKCISCKLCVNTCLMDVKKVGDRECINCGECKKVCKENAIKRFTI